MLNKLRLRLFGQDIRYYSQLLNEAEYHLKNYGEEEEEGVRPQRLTPCNLINFLRMTKLQLGMK